MKPLKRDSGNPQNICIEISQLIKVLIAGKEGLNKIIATSSIVDKEAIGVYLC